MPATHLSTGKDMLARNCAPQHTIPYCENSGLLGSRVKGGGSTAVQGSQGPWRPMTTAPGLQWWAGAERGLVRQRGSTWKIRWKVMRQHMEGYLW